MISVDDHAFEIYKERFSNILVPLAADLEAHIRDRIEYPRIDSIRCRAKTPSSFRGKSNKLEDGNPKYPDPLNQIQDQLGARIVTFYRTDLDPLCNLVTAYYAPIEAKDIVPDSEKEFDYEGKHFILFIPEALLSESIDRKNCPKFFELQIKTLFQHAWAEADHNIAYKPPEELTRIQKRIVACASAQSWGADYFFELLIEELGLA